MIGEDKHSGTFYISKENPNFTFNKIEQEKM